MKTTKQKTGIKIDKAKVKALIERLKKLDDDPELKEESEKHYRKISFLSQDDLFKRFTI